MANFLDINPITGPVRFLGRAGKALYPDIPEAPEAPEIDPRLREIRDRRFQLAQDFRAKAPGLEQQQYNLASDQSKGALSQARQEIKADTSRRGLLYSGIRKGQEAEAGAKAASDLATRRAQIARDIAGQQKQLEAEAFDSGARIQDMEQRRFDSIYNARMDRAKMQAQLAGTPGGIIGGLLRGFSI